MCPACGDNQIFFEVKLIPTNRQDYTYPKYIPQIKQLCLCGHFYKFAKQTPELIEIINKNISTLPIYEEPR